MSDWGDEDDADAGWGEDDGGDAGWGEDEDGWGGGGDSGGGDSGDGEELSLAVQLENAFYEADDLRLEDPAQALSQFLAVVRLAADHAELGDEGTSFAFKALQHVVSLHLAAGALDAMLEAYRALLAFIPRVTRNEGQEAVNRVLLEVGECRDVAFARRVYHLTSDVTHSLGDQERLWFRVNMKYAELCAAQAEKEEAERTLERLQASCQTADGADDPAKGAELLEIYALQTRLSMAAHDSAKLKELYKKTKHLTSAVKDPKSQSIIKECWGQMFGDQGLWSKAYAEFFSAFNSYSEIAMRAKAKQCLKYVVVANMLCGGSHNPFDAREAKAFQSEPDILAIEQLRKAHETLDVARFTKSLQELTKDKDQFILRHLGGIIRDFRGKAIVKTIKSYRRVRIAFLAQELTIDEEAVEELLVELILDGRVHGRIDQVNGLLDLTRHGVGGGAKYQALDSWARTLDRLMEGLPRPRPPESSGAPSAWGAARGAGFEAPFSHGGRGIRRFQ